MYITLSRPCSKWTFEEFTNKSFAYFKIVLMKASFWIPFMLYFIILVKWFKKMHLAHSDTLLVISTWTVSGQSSGPNCEYVTSCWARGSWAAVEMESSGKFWWLLDLSLLNATTTAFTLKNLLRHYAIWDMGINPWQVNITQRSEGMDNLVRHTLVMKFSIACQ